MSAEAILLTGTVGVGKTSVLLELGARLSPGPAPYALVDLDWLAWLRPAEASGVTVQAALRENLDHVARTYREAGVERLVLARAVRTREELSDISEALGGSRLTVVRLVAPAEVVEQRLRGRDSGAELAEHLEEAAAFAAEAAAAGIGDAVIDCGELTVSEVAARVLAAAGWD